MELSPEQQTAFDLYKSGKNIFISGPGGSGKSHLIQVIEQHAKSNGKTYQITATTGVAATNLEIKGAKNINSWAGIGVPKGDFGIIAARIAGNKYKKKPWKDVDVLVIDEVSMLSMDVFDLLDNIGRVVRKRLDEPFGGIQVIFSGDFYQLPPIGQDVRFCFESSRWKECFENQIVLNTIFRQNDSIFKSVLNQIREGRLNKQGYDLLQSRVGLEVPEGVTCTKIMPTRSAVDKINNSELQKLEGKEYRYKITRTCTDPMTLSQADKQLSRFKTETQREYEFNEMSRNLICDAETVFKEGCHVMCIANMEDLCNGSTGVITGFSGIGLPQVKFNNGIERIMAYYTRRSENIPDLSIMYMPLIPSWAITIHKSQGITLDYGEIDAGNGIFEMGQTYVALSRLRTIEGLFLSGFNPGKIRCHPKVKEFYS